MRESLKYLYLGFRTVLLRLLGVFLRLPAMSSGSPERILFIRIDRLGDMVLSTPALKAIKEKYPSARLSVLASPAAAGLLDGNPYVNEVYVWDESQGPAALLKTIKNLRAARFDLAVDPRPGYELGTAIIAFLSGARVRAGYDSHGRGVFLNLTTPVPLPGAHFSSEAFGVLKLIGIEGPGSSPELFIRPEAVAEAGNILKVRGVEESDIVVALHPGGYYPSQRWPADRFAAVARALMARYGAKILLIGSPGETGIIEAIISLLSAADRNNVVRTENLGIGTLCALIARSRLFIGNNSGPLHMAGALNIPSVSTMGPTDEGRWRPIGRNQIVLKAGLSCLSCGKGDCDTHECMNAITAEMMLENAERLLPHAHSEPQMPAGA